MNILFADIGLPMIGLYWPAAWLAIVPIIGVEAWIARRTLGTSWRSAICSVGTANLVSTLIGIPVAWLLMASVEGRFFGTARGLDTVGQRVYAVTLQAPWLIQSEADLKWMIPLAALTLTGAFYFVSTVIEWYAMRMIFRKSTRSQVWGWSWKANLLSYAGLYGIVLLCLYVPIPILNQIFDAPVKFIIDLLG